MGSGASAPSKQKRTASSRLQSNNSRRVRPDEQASESSSDGERSPDDVGRTRGREKSSHGREKARGGEVGGRTAAGSHTHRQNTERSAPSEEKRRSWEKREKIRSQMAVLQLQLDEIEDDGMATPRSESLPRRRQKKAVSIRTDITDSSEDEESNSAALTSRSAALSSRSTTTVLNLERRRRSHPPPPPKASCHHPEQMHAAAQYQHAQLQQQQIELIAAQQLQAQYQPQLQAQYRQQEQAVTPKSKPTKEELSLKHVMGCVQPSDNEMLSHVMRLVRCADEKREIGAPIDKSFVRPILKEAVLQKYNMELDDRQIQGIADVLKGHCYNSIPSTGSSAFEAIVNIICACSTSPTTSAAPTHRSTSLICHVANARLPRLFLGYRVSADAGLVEKIHDKLRAEGIDVWWDKRNLTPGLPWEDGFANGLCRCDVFLPVLSKSALAPCAKLESASPCDNVILEVSLKDSRFSLKGPVAKSTKPRVALPVV